MNELERELDAHVSSSHGENDDVMITYDARYAGIIESSNVACGDRKERPNPSRMERETRRRKGRNGKTVFVDLRLVYPMTNGRTAAEDSCLVREGAYENAVR